MVIDQAPGVYREDVFPAQPAALPTGVPAFLGRTSLGTADQPVRLTRFSRFTDLFGPPPAGRFLAAAVEGFFLNGGTECLVVPLAPSFDTDPEPALNAGLTALAAQQ